MIVQGHKVAEGSARGPVALSTAPLSFLGEIDPVTGRVDNPASELNGKVITGQVLVFPEARGSTVGPYVLYGARKRNTGPAALVVHQADAIVASAAVIARLPCVEQVDLDLFRAGEEVVVDGSKGTVEVPGVKGVPVVTALLLDPSGRVLLLKRSGNVGTYTGRWAGVSGYIEGGATPREQVLQEVHEELGLDAESLQLLGEGRPVYVREPDHVFEVHPFLFRVPSDTPVTLDWEHTESTWTLPSEIAKRETVPKLSQVWRELEAYAQPTSTPPAG